MAAWESRVGGKGKFLSRRICEIMFVLVGKVTDLTLGSEGDPLPGIFLGTGPDLINVDVLQALQKRHNC